MKIKKIIKDNILVLIVAAAFAFSLISNIGSRSGIFGLDFGLVTISLIGMMVGWVMIIILEPASTITGVIILAVSFLIGGTTIIVMSNIIANAIPGGWTTIAIVLMALFIIPRIRNMRQKQVYRWK